MQEVEINYDSINKGKLYEQLIADIINTCFKEENLKDLGYYISITLTTKENIRIINNKFRQIDKETDVLSFPIFEKNEIDNIRENNIKNIIKEPLGDIIISIDKVKEQAIEYGHSFERELSYMIVHGFYHIIGYDHIEEKDKKVMRQKEENILNILNQRR